MSQEKLIRILVPIGLFLSSVLSLLLKKMPIKPIFVKELVITVGSLLLSWTVVYLFIGKVINMVWNKIYKRYYIGGKWYSIYYSKKPTQKYVRVGTLLFKQKIDEVIMIDLIVRNAIIKNNQVCGFEDPADYPGQRISTGKGKYYIDFENLTIRGFFEMKRHDSSNNIDGSNIITIIPPTTEQKSPQRMEGNFYNAEAHITQNHRPTTGSNALFRNKQDAETFVMDLVQKYAIQIYSES